MSTVDAVTGATLPANTDVADVVAHMATMNTTLDKLTIPRFDNASSRNAKIPSPTVGQFAYLKQEKLYTYYDAVGAWKVFTNGQTVDKTVSEQVVNSTAAQPDDQMVFYAEANSVYWANAWFCYSADTVAPLTVSMTLLVPAGTTFSQRTCFGMAADSIKTRADSLVIARSSQAATPVIYGGPNTGNTAWIEESALIVTGSTAGNVNWAWTQATSSSTPLIVTSGSKMIVRKIS